jgi:opacity protein-like surface antigen
MKHFLVAIAGAVVVGGSVMAAEAVHEQHVQAATNAGLTELQVVEQVDARNLLTKDAQIQQLQSNGTALCSFISAHVNTKTVPLPTECK